VKARRSDPPGESLQLSCSRLLAVDAAGEGAHYRFIGWMPRRYRTWAYVAASEREWAVLIVPEWHPRRPVRLPRRQLPVGAVVPGGWMTADADLSAPYPARLSLAPSAACEDPGRVLCAAPEWLPGDSGVCEDSVSPRPVRPAA